LFEHRVPMKQWLLILGFLVLFLFPSGTKAQKIRAENRSNGKVLIIKSKKIVGLVTLDGEFFEGKPKIKGHQLQYGARSIPVDQIGILEVKKVSIEKVVGFPFKLVGIISGTAGLLLTAAYADDGGSEDSEIVIAGLALLGTGLGATLVDQALSAKKSKSTGFHVKDWRFSLSR